MMMRQTEAWDREGASLYAGGITAEAPRSTAASTVS